MQGKTEQNLLSLLQERNEETWVMHDLDEQTSTSTFLQTNGSRDIAYTKPCSSSESIYVHARTRVLRQGVCVSVHTGISITVWIHDTREKV